jgi:hypothetical protein
MCGVEIDEEKEGKSLGKEEVIYNSLLKQTYPQIMTFCFVYLVVLKHRKRL